MHLALGQEKTILWVFLWYTAVILLLMLFFSISQLTFLRQHIREQNLSPYPCHQVVYVLPQIHSFAI